MTIENKALPAHVAIIMDGNGRWAKERHMPRVMGHRAGMERVKKIVRLSSDEGIRYLTLFAFSTENWKRPSAEVNVLMGLLIEFLRGEIEEMHRHGVRIRTIGDIAGLPDDVITAIRNAEALTAENSGLTLVIALNYGARGELVRAARLLAERAKNGELDPQDISEETLSSALYTDDIPDPDLVIRTSGELRLSNFLLYQTAYSELYFTDVYWPDLSDARFLQALDAYAARVRRFGGL